MFSLFLSPQQQNILLGLSGGPPGSSPLDVLGSADPQLARRLAAISSGASTSTAQSPGLNLSSHGALPLKDEDDSLSPAFAAANILDLKEAIGGPNGKCPLSFHVAFLGKRLITACLGAS